jgi:hypothetical protein
VTEKISESFVVGLAVPDNLKVFVPFSSLLKAALHRTQTLKACLVFLSSLHNVCRHGVSAVQRIV